MYVVMAKLQLTVHAEFERYKYAVFLSLLFLQRTHARALHT